MSPEERQMLTELFERVRGQASAPRDRDAEAFINEAVRAQPYAPYLLSQAVIVQEQALRAADQKLQELQAQLSQLQQAQQGQGGGGGFLGGLFGGGQRPAQSQGSPWGGAPQQPAYAPPPPQGGAQGGPWGAQPPASAFGGAPQGGGFLKGALGAAAGVAGGVLLADSIRGLMGGHGGGLFGGGLGGLGGMGGGETVVNNFYDSPQDGGNGDYQNAADDDDGGDYGGDDDDQA